MYKKHEHIHFMGIGGIGMSGIAEILRLQGYTVTGCDTTSNNKTIDHLKKIGCSIAQTHDKSHIIDADVLVYSSAVDHNNPEVQAALEKGIPVIPRALMLAELMRTKYSIAVSGAHGKTTTTSLISHIFIEAPYNPTVIVGGVLKNINNNAQLGNSDILIAEADESDRSLLYLNPTMAVVTNIDAEHLDTYKDIEDIKNTFKNFLARLPFYGKAILCIDDPHIQSILPLPHINVVKYGLDEEKADLLGEICELNPTNSVFTMYTNKIDHLTQKRVKRLLGTVTINIPGIHNVLNALAATALCMEFDMPFITIATALASFKGVERRFEFKGAFKGIEVFDDYGHHPTEIKNTLMIAHKRKKNKLHVIFQPHRYSRTQKLWDEFIAVFAHSSHNYSIDSLTIADIYPASEQPIPDITSEKLVSAIKIHNKNLDVTYAPSYDSIVKNITTNLADGDMVITIGAGKINKVGEELLAIHKDL
ncbi:MAG: UDP-N-acetylmuramate-L-alanine ligase [candidate division TM6 bacterium GW2011_GWF2_38_10]|nr:MAG: UDP-N-acetylmuramate-L-alanine ligase [candidate division TM6 bacterium GW2011_GWF2_38_10]